MQSCQTRAPPSACNRLIVSSNPFRLSRFHTQPSREIVSGRCVMHKSVINTLGWEFSVKDPNLVQSRPQSIFTAEHSHVGCINKHCMCATSFLTEHRKFSKRLLMCSHSNCINNYAVSGRLHTQIRQILAGIVLQIRGKCRQQFAGTKCKISSFNS